MPYVGDSKRAMDEYTSEIFMGGKNTIVLHNTCEDSLLAAPIILDLVLLAELSSRIQFKSEEEVMSDWSHCSNSADLLNQLSFFITRNAYILQAKFHSFHPVATILSYLTKAPLVSLTLFLSAHKCFIVRCKTTKGIVG